MFLNDTDHLRLHGGLSIGPIAQSRATEIHYAELKTGEKGVAIGLEDRFLQVEKEKNNWRLKLLYLPLDESLTAWTSVRRLGDLRTARRYKHLRESIGVNNLEKVLIEIEEHMGEFEDRSSPESQCPSREETKASGYCDQGIFELIVNEQSEPTFLVYNKGEFVIRDSVTFNNHVYVPKGLNQIPYRPYRFCNDPLPNLDEIYQRIYREFGCYVDLEEIWLHVLSASVLLTYQQEKVQTVPYIYLVGDNESGKTTVLNVQNQLCYRTMFGITIPPADLYGYLEDADCIPTILEDEIQGVGKDIDKVKIYKSGYKRGAVVPRTVLLEHGREIHYYNTFCLKSVAAERTPTAKGFTERFVIIPMIQGYPEKEWADNTITDSMRFQELRSLLLKWRLTTRDEPLPNLELPFKGRVKELWKPLLQVTYGLRVYQVLLDFVESQIKERIETKQNTLEGRIVKVVGELYKGSPMPPNIIWEQLLQELEGTIDDKKAYVMWTSDFDRVTKSKVGYRLRESLGGKRDTQRVQGEITKVWIFDREKLRRVLKKYGYDSLVTKLPLLPTSLSSDKDNDKPETFRIGFVPEKDGDLEGRINGKPVTMPKEVGNVGNTVTERNVFLWKQVRPSEKCPLCGSLTVEYEIVIDGGTLLRRCPSCFSMMRGKFTKVEWIEDEKEARFCN